MKNSIAKQVRSMLTLPQEQQHCLNMAQDVSHVVKHKGSAQIGCTTTLPASGRQKSLPIRFVYTSLSRGLCEAKSAGTVALSLPTDALLPYLATNTLNLATASPLQMTAVLLAHYYPLEPPSQRRAAALIEANLAFGLMCLNCSWASVHRLHFEVCAHTAADPATVYSSTHKRRAGHTQTSAGKLARLTSA